MSHNHQNLMHPMPLPSSQAATIQTRSAAVRNTYSPETHRGVYCRSVTSAGSTSGTPSMTRSSRSSRAAGPLIDLTESSPGGFPNPSVSELRLPLPKRRRTLPPSAETEKVDLSIAEDENEFSLKKNREDLLKAQEGDNGGQRKKLAGFGCVICMEDEPVDLAVTPCGMHLTSHLQNLEETNVRRS